MPTYHDHLAAHLDGKEHPLPHPGLTEHGQRITPRKPTADTDPLQEQMAKAKAQIPAAPGPITMHEPRVDWLGRSVRALVLVASVVAVVGLIALGVAA